MSRWQDWPQRYPCYYCSQPTCFEWVEDGDNVTHRFVCLKPACLAELRLDCPDFDRAERRIEAAGGF